MVKEKVYAYITRMKDARTEVLVFSYAHEPESGTQVPGGSLEPGETPAEGALREVREEVRVAAPRIIRHIGSFAWYCGPEARQHVRHVFHVDAGEALPDTFATRCRSDSEDDGWLFQWRWLDRSEATTSLFGEQGRYLVHL